MCYLFQIMSGQKEIWNVTRLLKWTTGFFQERKLHSPRLSAEVLLAAVMGWERIDLYARFDYILEKGELDKFRDHVRKAADGFPVSYIIGEKEFYSITFKVSPDVLIPRPESELLVDAATDYLRRLPHPGLVWDVCTGSGCVAIAIASNAPVAGVLATDVSPPAVAVASSNVERLGLGDRVMACEADLISVPSDWNHGSLFDCITANPPYVATTEPLGTGVDSEPEIALRAGHDGLDLIRPLIDGVCDRLNDGGLFCMEFGVGQADAIQELVDEVEEFESSDILYDIQDLPRTLVATRGDR